MATQSSQPTLGTVLRAIRTRNDWTLREMSDRCGIPVSTLSKVEHDRLTLSYDKLQQLSRRLNIRMSDLFAEGADERTPQVMGRRSIALAEQALRVVTDNYDYRYLSTDLRRKRMIPILVRIRSRSPSEFGELVRHQGEEFLYVLEGRVAVHSEFYDPVVLETGQGIYIDSTMGHAYLAAEGCEEALALAVCSSADENLQDSLISLHN